MNDYSKILKNDERAIFDLLDLYSRYGYRRFKSGKFEEYELYARNKDFIGQDSILTFTDSSGKLMALKPDVTLSVARNSKYSPGQVRRFSYNDYVYRRSRDEGTFKEIRQTGIECIGDIGSYDVCEVIMLAVKSLNAISSDFILDISHMGIVRGITNELSLSEDDEERVLSLIGDKNFADVRKICELNAVDKDRIEKVIELIGTYGPIDDVLSSLDRLACNNTMKRSVDELKVIASVIEREGFEDKVRFDFSVVNDMGYYNGVTFLGYIKGISSRVLSGGRYDRLMSKMGQGGGAIGFSISIDKLKQLDRGSREYDVDVVLIDRPGEDIIKLDEAVSAFVREGLSVSVQKSLPSDVKYRRAVELFDGEVRDID